MGYTTDFLLLMTTTNGDLVGDGTAIDLGLAGATLCDLVEMGRLDLDENGRISVLDVSATGSAVLDEACQRFAGKAGKKAGSALQKVAKDLRDGAYGELQGQGAVVREDFKTLGIFSRHKWPVHDRVRLVELRRVVLAALERPELVDARLSGLVSLVSATDMVKHVVADLGSTFSVRELKKNAKTIATGDLEGVAVSKATQNVQAAVNAAVVAAVTTAVVTGSG